MNEIRLPLKQKYRRVAVLLPRFTPGDAVSNDAVKMFDSLCDEGVECRIFVGGQDGYHPALYDHSSLESFVNSSDDLLIYHHSIAWDRALTLFQTTKAKRLFRYHNVTPPIFFDPYHAGIANSCRVGRSMVRSFIELKPELYLSASVYNQQELIEWGGDIERMSVLPPFPPLDFLKNIDPDLRVLERYATQMPGGTINFLSVGRIVPNKNYEEMIEAFAVFRSHAKLRSRLILVGKMESSLTSYYSKLSALMFKYNLIGSVHFLGKVSERGLRSCYLASTIFLTTSLHEGFCVPLLEAMAQGVPVTGYNSCAIQETAGDAALLFDAGNPAVLASAMYELATNHDLLLELRKRGFERAAEFEDSLIKKQFLDSLTLIQS